MGLRVWIWLLSLSVLWGGSFFFAKVAIGELGPLTVVFARVALAALALESSWSRRGQIRSDATRRGPPIFAMGLLNNVLPFSLIFWGQTHIASGLASILNATTPLFTLLVAHFLTEDEKIDPAKVAALLAGFAGVAVLIGPELPCRRRERVGRVGLPGRRPFLCLRRRLRPALQDDENRADRGRRRSGHCKYRVDSADHAGRRAAVDAAGVCPPSRSGRRWAAWRCCRRRSPTSCISAFWPPPAPPTCCSSPS